MGTQEQYYGNRQWWNQALTNFARDHGDDVHAFIQGPLWEETPGVHFWGQVPGTSRAAYKDDDHLLWYVAEAYLWPYMCSAFEDAGFFAPI